LVEADKIQGARPIARRSSDGKNACSSRRSDDRVTSIGLDPGERQ
jgi:hypothetical protein